MFINKLNHTSFSQGYIHRLMNILGITANKPNMKWLTDITEFSKLPVTKESSI